MAGSYKYNVRLKITTTTTTKVILASTTPEALLVVSVAQGGDHLALDKVVAG